MFRSGVLAKDEPVSATRNHWANMCSLSKFLGTASEPKGFLDILANYLVSIPACYVIFQLL